MKYKVLIEETISEMFEIDAKNLDKAHSKIRNGYLKSAFVLNDPGLESVDYVIFDSKGERALTDFEKIV